VKAKIALKNAQCAADWPRCFPPSPDPDLSFLKSSKFGLCPSGRRFARNRQSKSAGSAFLGQVAILSVNSARLMAGRVQKRRLANLREVRFANPLQGPMTRIKFAFQCASARSINSQHASQKCKSASSEFGACWPVPQCFAITHSFWQSEIL
jgi:hypothetical protein